MARVDEKHGSVTILNFHAETLSFCFKNLKSNYGTNLYKIGNSMKRILASFRLMNEKEEIPEVIKNIESGVVFRGTNLWVLTFAIFVASLGLNVNSTAVIIGAMLISPLMGPIIGMGLGMGI